MKGWTIAIILGLLLLLLLVLLSAVRPRQGLTVERIRLTNPNLTSALAKAKSGLPIFIEGLAHPLAGQRFAFMTGFPTPAGPEYLWVKDPTISAGKIRGTLDQQPMVAKVQKGAVVAVELKSVVDWMIRNPDGTTLGGFTQGLNP